MDQDNEQELEDLDDVSDSNFINISAQVGVTDDNSDSDSDVSFFHQQTLSISATTHDS